MKAAALVITLLSTAGLNGCGQKGPLVLPDGPTAVGPNAPPTSNGETSSGVPSTAPTAPGAARPADADERGADDARNRSPAADTGSDGG